jgi:galactonate dehydratase
MNRRYFLGSLAFVPLTGAKSAEQSQRVTCEDVQVHVVKVNARGNWIVVQLKASNGLTGLGDASHGKSDASTLEYIKTFAGLLRGSPISGVERFRAMAAPAMARHDKSAIVAFGGLEQCLWDLLGKTLGMPSSELFGGRQRERIRNYANINRSTPGRDPDAFARMAARAVAAGFDAVKLAPFDGMPRNAKDATRAEITKTGIECAAAVRQAIGPKRDLLIDAHSHFDLPRGLELAKRVEPLNLYWLEEVVRAYDQLAVINRKAQMPTAGGENVYGVKGFLEYVNAKAVDIAMPDIKYCGGLLELKKIAALCEAAGMPVSPHGPASPVGNYAAAHVCSGLANFHILEHSFGEVPWRAELVNPPEEMDGGQLVLSSRPGFGVSLNEKIVARYRA